MVSRNRREIVEEDIEARSIAGLQVVQQVFTDTRVPTNTGIPSMMSGSRCAKFLGSIEKISETIQKNRKARRNHPVFWPSCAPRSLFQFMRRRSLFAAQAIATAEDLSPRLRLIQRNRPSHPVQTWKILPDIPQFTQPLINFRREGCRGAAGGVEMQAELFVGGK
jgi:hypothetical protein